MTRNAGSGPPPRSGAGGSHAPRWRPSTGVRSLLRTRAGEALPSAVPRDPEPVRGRGGGAGRLPRRVRALGSGRGDGGPDRIPLSDGHERLPLVAPTVGVGHETGDRTHTRASLHP